MNQAWENDEKPNFEPNYCRKLSLYAISRKTNEPNLKKMAKKLNFGLDFSSFGPNLGRQNFFRGFYFY